MKVNLFGWNFTVTPARYFLTAVALLGIIVIVFRLVTGMGAVTNLSDEWPWGLWIAFDVLTGVALAGGGYSTALIVHILHQDRYYPVARGAMLTSLLGYLLVMAGLFLDIGQWFNFWRPFVSWGHASVLFEVFWCVSIYTSIQFLEFGEVVTERIGRKWHLYFKKMIPVLMIIGVVLPTLHQSSLGALFLIAVHKVYPLWWSEWLPAYFLLSSFFVGPAMVCVESILSGRVFRHPVPLHVLRGLAYIGGVMMFLYLLLKVHDFTVRGLWPLVFKGNLQSWFFFFEMGLCLCVPLGILFTLWGRTKSGLLTYGVLTSLGVIMNRLNTAITAMVMEGKSLYFPSIWEIIVSAALLAMGCLLYCFIVENFYILDYKPKADKEKVPMQHRLAEAELKNH